MSKNLYASLLLLFSFVCFSQFHKPWDTLFPNYKVEITRWPLSTTADEFAPISLKETFLFTSTSYFSKTDEISLKHNQRIYITSDKKKKIEHPFNFDEQMAIGGCLGEQNGFFIYMPFGNGDLYASYFRNNEFTHPKKLPYPINQAKTSEQSVAWKDGEYIFSSDRKGTYDLYKATLSGKKSWVVEPMEKLNSPYDEVDVRTYKDWLFFSSNRNGKFKPFIFAENEVKPISILPDSFSSCDVRDFLWMDSVFYFSANLHGNYDIYEGRIIYATTINETLVKNDSVQKDTTVQDSTHQIDASKLQSTTLAKHTSTNEKINRLYQILDSLGIVYPIQSYVQVGAYYGIQSIEEFKKIFVAFDTCSIIIEKIPTEKGILHKFLLLPSYDNLEIAIARQQIALEQQACKCNKKISNTDAFVALYDANKKRIGIYFNNKKKEYILFWDNKRINY